MPFFNQRQGVLTRLVRFFESAPGTVDAASGQVMPLASPVEFGGDTNRVDVANWNGTRLPAKTLKGNSMFQLSVQLNLEFLAVLPRLIKQGFGGGYTFINNTGAGLGIHRCIIPITPATSTQESCELQGEYTEATEIDILDKFVRLNGLGFTTSAAEGGVVYNADFIGSGDESTTKVPAATVVDDAGPLVGNSYFNGYAFMGALGSLRQALDGLSSFDWNLAFNVKRTDAAFKSGLAAALPQGLIGSVGNLALHVALGGAVPESDFNFRNYAVNETEVWVECFWCDRDPAVAAPTAWLRVLQLVKFTKGKVVVGGDAGQTITQPYKMERSTNAKFSGEKWGNTGPFNITAGAFNIGIKVNGGATTTIALTQGAARTTDQVVSEINANGTFSPLGVARNQGGRVHIYTRTSGTGGSVQIDTGVATSAHSVLGFDGVVAAGLNDCPLIVEVVNSRVTAYTN